MKEISGTDAALYLIFLRYAATFYFIMLILSAGMIIPVYISGSPLASDLINQTVDFSSLQVPTILNITGNNSKVALIFAFIFVTQTGMALAMVYYYWKKSNLWRYRSHSHTQPFKDHDVAIHSILITEIPQKLPSSEATLKLISAFDKMFPPCGSKVLNAKVVGKQNKLYKLCL